MDEDRPSPSETTPTRYLEHFVQRGPVTFSGTQAYELSSEGIVPGTAAVKSLDGNVAYRAGVDYVSTSRPGRSPGPIPARSRTPTRSRSRSSCRR